MSRTVSETLLDAIANQQGETILRVKTWADLAAYNLAPTVAETTWETTKFEIKATSASALIISPSNDYTISDFTVFLIERGVSISGVEYVTQSDIFFVTKYNERPGIIELEGSSYPDQKVILDGDDTYENVITAFCTAIGKTAVFKDSGAAWLSYQFLATGKQVILNKAARFESLIRQKYLIQCYARSPKELFFYHAATEQSVWKNIIFADSTLVLAASSGSHQIATSSDGLGYTKTTAPSFTNALAYSPTLDLFVAVGNGICITSPDGITWTSRTIGSGNWTDIVWDTTLAKFIAVRTGASATSTNGITWTVTVQKSYDHTWTNRTVAESNQWLSVCWSTSLSLFAAVSFNGTNRVMTSPDGITWTARSAAAANQWRSICWSPDLSLFVAVSDSGTNRVMTSPDGITWTSRTPSTYAWKSVCWSPELSIFVAVAQSGASQVMTSPDGITWTNRTAAAANTWTSVCWSAALSLFVAVSSNGTNRVMTSPDGITWTSRSAANSYTWESVCWSPEAAIFVAVATTSGTNSVMTSTDGITWTAQSTHPQPGSANGSWNTVCWSPEAAIFVIIGSQISTSPDGITWTERSTSGDNVNCVSWATSIYTFVAVGSGSGGIYAKSSAMSDISLVSLAANSNLIVAVGVSTAYTTTNGSSWTTRTIPTGTYNKILYSDGLFVAVGNSKCATSPDGVTWTSRTIPAGNYLGLAYSSTLDLFVAIGDNLLATSPDGITWTTRTAPADQAWQAVAWSDSLAKFFTISSDGDNRIASSDDGINWQTLTTSADFSLDYLDGPRSSIEHGTKQVYFIWRKEDASTGSEGDTSYPAWNLGYLESTDSPPQTNADPFYKFYIQKAPLRLDMTDGDRVHFSPSWTLDPTKAIDAMITIVEVFDTTKSPAWYQDIRSITIFDGVEGGALPSTIERVAAYTPLVSSGFNGNLTPEVNNLQALAEAVDNLTISGYTPPTTTAANDFQVGDGSGNWIKKTLAQVITILGIFADAASDSIYYVRRNAGWTNLKTYTDTLYSLLGHAHAASDITSGTMATARLGSGTANSSTYLRGDQTYATPKAYQTYNGHGLNGTVAAGATQYTPVGQWGLSSGNYGFVVNRAGKIKNLYQRINSTQPASGSLVVTVYVNGVASSLVLTIAASSVTGVYSETSTEVSVSAGAAIVVGIKNNASGASAFIGANSLDFEYSVV